MQKLRQTQQKEEAGKQESKKATITLQSATT
jgi:hypothetical protein